MLYSGIPIPAYLPSVMKSSELSLVVAIDEGNDTVARRLIPNSPRRDLENALHLCLARKSNEEILKRILSVIDDPELVDRTFHELAWEGVHPFTVRIFMEFISQRTSRDAYRIIKDARRRGDYSYYFVTFLEEDRYKEIFETLLPQRLKRTGRHRISNQSWINDLFLSEIMNNHRYVVCHMLSRTPGTLRPSDSVVLKGFLMALSRGNFHMAELLIHHDEGPLEKPKDLYVSQMGVDFAFQEIVEEENLPALKYLLSRVQVRPEQSAIEAAYNRFSSRIYIEQLVSERVRREFSYGVPSSKRRAAEVAKFRHFYAELVDVLTRNVPPSLVEAGVQRERRARERQRRIDELRYGGGAPEIHSFSGTQVNVDQQRDDENEEEGDDEVPSPDPDQPQATNQTHTGGNSARKTLVGAVEDFLKGKCDALMENGTLVYLPPIEDVEEAITRLINREFTTHESREDAIEKLTQGIDSSSQSTLVKTWVFLTHYHPDQILVWLAGSLGESVSARSCNPGVAERIMTGLRGINDPELDVIFGQVEGPLLARTFLNNAFNIFPSFAVDHGRHHGGSTAAQEFEIKKRRCDVIAAYLVKEGIVADSSDEDVAEVLKRYATEGVVGYGVKLTEFEALIDVVVDLAVDSYDDFLKPVVLQHLQNLSTTSSPLVNGSHAADAL